MTIAVKYFPLISLALNCGIPLWFMGMRACKEKSENIFSSYCKKDVDKLRECSKVFSVARRNTKTKPNQTKRK